MEVSDIVNSTRLKFGEAAGELERLFLICSEIIARAHENLVGFMPEIDKSALVNEFYKMEGKLLAISRLRRLVSPDFQTFARSAKLFILVNPLPNNDMDKFFARGFPDNRSAVEAYSKLEKEYQDRADVVLVGATEQDAIRLAYTNYFSDASDFVSYLDTALKKLSNGIACA